jgi:hypothetical protein
MRPRHAPRDAVRWLRFKTKIAAMRCASAWRFAPTTARHNLPNRLIVSLTSYPPRFRTLGLTLRSLLSQDIRPDATVLWIANTDIDLLPRHVMMLQKYGLSIRPCKDTRSYKKIIPALAAYPDAIIVTADDDVDYPKDWLRTLVHAYRSPREVLCQQAVLMIPNGSGYIPYRMWPLVREDGATGPDIFPIGVGGVLYPPGSLSVHATDVSKFMQLCPTGDDIWLHWMGRQTGSIARFIKPNGPFRNWPTSQTMALWRKNDFGGGNDRQIAAMVEAYGRPCAESAIVPRAAE